MGGGGGGGLRGRWGGGLCFSFSFVVVVVCLFVLNPSNYENRLITDFTNYQMLVARTGLNNYHSCT